MKNIIITGASGLVATELINNLLKKEDCCLFLISTHVEKIQGRYMDNESVRCFSLVSFSDYINQNNICFDICIHTAFARSSQGVLIVESLNFQQKLMTLFNANNLKTFVNISSQSVYGKRTEPLWTENAPLDPDYLYAMGKYSSEVITELLLKNSGIGWCNIRLCSVCEYARFVRIFVQNAIEGTPINLTAPNQVCSFIDIRDVASAIVKIISNTHLFITNHIYNLGANHTNTIKDVALLVKHLGEYVYHTPTVVITEADNGSVIKVGMDASHFMNDFSWKPQYGMKDMIVSLFEMIMNKHNIK